MISIDFTEYQARYLRRKLHNWAKEHFKIAKYWEVGSEAYERNFTKGVMLDSIAEELKLKLETLE
jgi:hypothetical protein